MWVFVIISYVTWPSLRSTKLFSDSRAGQTIWHLCMRTRSQVRSCDCPVFTEMTGSIPNINISCFTEIGCNIWGVSPFNLYRLDQGEKRQSIFCQSPIQISEAKTPLWKLQENSLIFDPKSVWYNSNTHYFIWPSALAITFETTTPIDVLSHFVFCDCSYLFYCFLLLAGFCLDFGGPCGWPIAQKCLAINCQKVPKFKAERRQNIGKIPKKYDNGMTNLNDLTTFVQCRNTERKERISRHLCVCCLYL